MKEESPEALKEIAGIDIERWRICAFTDCAKRFTVGSYFRLSTDE
jgi:hypothetical protein